MECSAKCSVTRSSVPVLAKTSPNAEENAYRLPGSRGESDPRRCADSIRLRLGGRGLKGR